MTVKPFSRFLRLLRPSPPVRPIMPSRERPRPRRVCYLPMWAGSQILPLPVIEEHSDQPRDLYADE